MWIAQRIKSALIIHSSTKKAMSRLRTPSLLLSHRNNFLSSSSVIFPRLMSSQSPANLEPLLVSHGGKWTLTSDGEALERSFKFKNFTKTWVCIDNMKKKFIYMSWYKAMADVIKKNAGFYDGCFAAVQDLESSPWVVKRKYILNSLKGKAVVSEWTHSCRSTTQHSFAGQHMCPRVYQTKTLAWPHYAMLWPRTLESWTLNLQVARWRTWQMKWSRMEIVVWRNEIFYLSTVSLWIVCDVVLEDKVHGSCKWPNQQSRMAWIWAYMGRMDSSCGPPLLFALLLLAFFCRGPQI